MKKVFFITLFSVIALTSFSQTGELTNAILAHKDGIFAEAKTSIDKAILHEKTMNEAKTWYYRGKIYESISIDPTLSKQYPEAAKTAFEAYTKARQLDETAAKPNKYKKDLDEAFASQNLAIVVQNGGINAYKDKNYDEAYNYFTMYQTLKPQDTAGYIFAAQMALAKDDYKKAKESYIKGIEKTGYVTPDILTNLIYIHKNVESEKNYDKALEYARMGRAKFPHKTSFATDEADLLEKTGKTSEAITNLEAAIQKGDKKAENYLILGSLYEKNNQIDKAKEAYGNALQLNPNSFEANYNMGALLYNPAVEIIKTVRNMSMADYKKKGVQMESQAKEVLKLSLPYFEKAYAVKSTDNATKKTLRDVYMSLGMKDKADALK